MNTIKSKRVLVVDDDDDILDIMEEILTYEGYGVSSLDDTNDIFSEINRNRPDVIILDYILNGINGGEICHQIKTNPNTADIPVILMSAYPRVFGSLGNYGCNAFIAKPFDLNDITGRVNELMNTSQNAGSC